MAQSPRESPAILEPVTLSAKARRMNGDTFGFLLQSGSSGVIAGLLVFSGGAGFELVFGAFLSLGLFSAHLQTVFSLRTQSERCIKRIAPKSIGLMPKELIRAWIFIPGAGSHRILETFYVNENTGPFGKLLSNGLMYVSKRCDKLRATHRVTQEIRSSWRGIEIIQNIEPLDTYLWQHAFNEVKTLYDIHDGDNPADFSRLKGTTKERIAQIENISTMEAFIRKCTGNHRKSQRPPLLP